MGGDMDERPCDQAGIGRPTLSDFRVLQHGGQLRLRFSGRRLEEQCSVAHRPCQRRYPPLGVCWYCWYVSDGYLTCKRVLITN